MVQLYLILIFYGPTDLGGHTQSPIQCVSGALSPVIKRDGMCNWLFTYTYCRG